MHPDRRRAGRAIRKQRRLEREALEAFGFGFAAFVALATQAFQGFALALRGVGEAFISFSEAVGGASERDHPSSLAVAQPLVLSEVGVPSHTQSGVKALKSAPVAGESMSPKQEFGGRDA